MPATESIAPPLATLSRHADVVQALHDPRLAPLGQGASGPEAHEAVRAAARQLQSPARMAAWRDDFAARARSRVQALPGGTPVDLVTALAAPWSLDVALQVAGLSSAQGTDCAALAHRLFEAAARSTDGSMDPGALQAATTLARHMAGASAGLADVQTFVALSQSLPALLAGAWRALLLQPDALAALLATPDAVRPWVDELLRLGGPAQAVFREAREDLAIGPVRVRRGECVALMLAQANRDAAAFAEPGRMDPARAATGMLSLGAGPHRCAGAALVRMALGVATQALLEGSASLALADPSASAQRWVGGFAVRAPAALWVLRQARAGAVQEGPA